MKTTENQKVIAAAVLRQLILEMREASANVSRRYLRQRVGVWRTTLEGVAEGLEAAESPEVGFAPEAELSCGRAKSDMTPCVVGDGKVALSVDEFCVGCDVHLSRIPDPDGVARG